MADQKDNDDMTQKFAGPFSVAPQGENTAEVDIDMQFPYGRVRLVPDVANDSD